MGVSKVVYAGRTLIDISDSTITQDMLPEGVVAYDWAGNRLVGQAPKVNFRIYDWSQDAIVYQGYNVPRGTTWGDYAAANTDKGFLIESTVSFDGSEIRDSRGRVVQPEWEIESEDYGIN